MGCFVLQNCYLQFIEGKVSESNYEFACEYYNQLVQDQVSYFAIDLNQLYPNSDILKQNQKQNMIVGILYDFQQNISLNIKKFIISCLKDSIYFKQGCYQEGFENLILAIKNFICSSESQKNEKMIYFSSGLIDYFMVNLMLKVGDKIYVSKSVSTLDLVSNQWYIKADKTYKLLDKQVDLVDLPSNYYQIKLNLTQNLQEILLTSKQCCDKTILQDVRKLYPCQQEDDVQNHMYFLKIKF
ncbi:hypothetical protein ABPG72_013336 [Tetrahymena utriculariae]